MQEGPQQARVAILMGTKNGARYLSEQLDSLEAQTHQNWFLCVSDDGSIDETLKILRCYQARWTPGKLIIKDGLDIGFSSNFLSLACDFNISANYYAFCDQDDVWLPAKLERALSKIVSMPTGAASMYCGRTIYINENSEVIGESPKFVHLKTFRNALVQCIAGGNTIVFNDFAKKLLEKMPFVKVPSHDWWTYLIVTGSGGDVYFDLTPQVRYRQHPNNLVGENKSFSSRLERLNLVFKGYFAELINQNLIALSGCINLLTKENKNIFYLFIKMRSLGLKDRIRIFGVCGLYRQTWQGTATLFVAAMLKKI